MSEIVEISPADLRFSHDTISSTFKDGTPLTNLFEKIADDSVYINRVPLVSVMLKDNIYWVTDGNRRLFVYKRLWELAALTKIIVKLVSFNAATFNRVHTSTNGGLDVEVRGASSTADFRNQLGKIWINVITKRVQSKFEFRNPRTKPMTSGVRSINVSAGSNTGASEDVRQVFYYSGEIMKTLRIMFTECKHQLQVNKELEISCFTLQTERDHWKKHACEAEDREVKLQTERDEWKERALVAESLNSRNRDEFHRELGKLQSEVDRLRLH